MGNEQKKTPLRGRKSPPKEPKPAKEPKVPATPADTVRLNIKREFLDQIVAGTKKVEYRDATPHNCKLLLVLDAKGQPVDYKPIKKAYFHVERNANPTFALVEVTGMASDKYLDPDTGEDSSDQHGEGTGDYYIELHLGAVLETNVPKAA